MNQDYSRKIIRTDTILTNSYVACTTVGIDDNNLHLKNQLVLLLKITKGSLTSFQFKIEFSDDNTNWYQESSGVASGGTVTETPVEHSITLSADQNIRVALPIKDKYVKVSVKGTGTVTSSSLQVVAVVGIQ